MPNFVLNISGYCRAHKRSSSLFPVCQHYNSGGLYTQAVNGSKQPGLPKYQRLKLNFSLLIKMGWLLWYHLGHKISRNLLKLCEQLVPLLEENHETSTNSLNCSQKQNETNPSRWCQLSLQKWGDIICETSYIICNCSNDKLINS